MAEERPAGVPEGAWVNGNEWELGERDSQGRFQGIVRWWRMDGTLCCRTEHVDGRPHGTFQRFHPNGEISREGTFDNGSIVGIERFHRSTAATTEYFAVYSADRRVWTAVNDHTRGVRTFLDKKGQPCDQKGRPVEPEPVVVEGPAWWAAPPASTATLPEVPEPAACELLDGVFFTPALRRLIRPRRDGVRTPVRPLPDLDTAWAALREALWACDTVRLAHERAKDDTARSTLWSLRISDDGRERALGERIFAVDARVGSEDEDVLLLERLLERYSGALVAGNLGDLTYARAADFLVASLGLPEACRRALLGIRDELPYQRMAYFERLRELLAIAEADVYTAAREAVEAGYEEAVGRARQKSYVGRTPAHIAWAASFLLPVGRSEDPLARRLHDIALKACVGRGFGNDELNAGGLASTDLAGLARFRAVNDRVRHEFFAGGVYLAGVLDQARGEAVEAIAAMKVSYPFEDSEVYNGCWLFLLAHFDDDRALPPMVGEHALGRRWGLEALALARQVRGEAVDVWLAANAPDLVEAVRSAAPLTLGQSAEPVLDGTPSAYLPPPVVRAEVVPTRIAVPDGVDWREAADGYEAQAPTWDGVALGALDTSGQDAWMAHRERWALPTAAGDLAHAPERFLDRLLALGVDPQGHHRWGLGAALVRWGTRVVPFLRALLDLDLSSYVPFALPFGSTVLFAPLALGFAGKAQRVPCRAWITRHPRHAWAGALDGLEGDRKLADASGQVLRYLAGIGHRDAILVDAAAIGVADTVRGLLDDDWLLAPKAKRPK
ncbi:MAG: hypothetical protein KC656_14375, partial [Myxococcales bacterium]|nr:hypothetical protein [Myxococcales bacterium]